MTIDSSAALLRAALQDLLAGKLAQRDRLPGIAEHAQDAALAALLGEEARRAAEQAARIDRIGVDAGSQDNLWAAGILDDAERDTRQTQAGRLLDIALIGAIRKAKAAEIVSSETALSLADAVGADAMHAVTAANYAEEIATDRALKARLIALAGDAG